MQKLLLFLQDHPNHYAVLTTNEERREVAVYRGDPTESLSEIVSSGAAPSWDDAARVAVPLFA